MRGRRVNLGWVFVLLGAPFLWLFSADKALADARCDAFATGGTVSLITAGGQNFCVHQFTSAGTSTFTLLQDRDVNYLIIGGGGGAGTGGGGAGGMLESTISRTAGIFSVTVGAGGAATSAPGVRGVTGGDSTVFGIMARGGGGGGRNNLDDASILNGLPGGSGGGGGRNSVSTGSGFGGAGEPEQGSAGANTMFSINAGGGGGGAGGAAGGINGGPGRVSSITGTAITYAGGGASARGTSSIINGTSGAGQGQAGGGGAHRENGSLVFTPGKDGLVVLRYAINTAPTAAAGADANAFAGLEFTLDGTGSTDPDGASATGNITTYAWQQLTGSAVTLLEADTAQARFTPTQPANGAAEELSFRLTVTDAFGLQSTDDVIITLQGMAELIASKTARVFSQDGAGCADLEAVRPAEPALPAAIPGACIEYTISVENIGPVPATAIDLTDQLPPEVTYAAAGTRGWTAATLAAAGNTVSLTAGEIAVGATGPTAATIIIRAWLN